MQTLSVQVQDNYVQKLKDFVHSHSENMIVTKDKNLEYDPYFYERQKELEQVIEERVYRSHYFGIATSLDMSSN